MHSADAEDAIGAALFRLLDSKVLKADAVVAAAKHRLTGARAVGRLDVLHWASTRIICFAFQLSVALY